MVAHHAGALNVPAVPRAAVNTKRAKGDSPPARVTNASPAVQRKNSVLAESRTRRRSAASETAPAGRAKIRPGSDAASGSAATREGTWVSRAITKPAITDSIHTPMFEVRALVHRRRKDRMDSGVAQELPGRVCGPPRAAPEPGRARARDDSGAHLTTSPPSLSLYNLNAIGKGSDGLEILEPLIVGQIFPFRRSATPKKGADLCAGPSRLRTRRRRPAFRVARTQPGHRRRCPVLA